MGVDPFLRSNLIVIFFFQTLKAYLIIIFENNFMFSKIK